MFDIDKKINQIIGNSKKKGRKSFFDKTFKKATFSTDKILDYKPNFNISKGIGYKPVTQVKRRQPISIKTKPVRNIFGVTDVTYKGVYIRYGPDVKKKGRTAVTINDVIQVLQNSKLVNIAKKMPEIVIENVPNQEEYVRIMQDVGLVLRALPTNNEKRMFGNVAMSRLKRGVLRELRNQLLNIYQFKRYKPVNIKGKKTASYRYKGIPILYTPEAVEYGKSAISLVDVRNVLKKNPELLKQAQQGLSYIVIDRYRTKDKTHPNATINITEKGSGVKPFIQIQSVPSKKDIKDYGKKAAYYQTQYNIEGELRHELKHLEQYKKGELKNKYSKKLEREALKAGQFR